MRTFSRFQRDGFWLVTVAAVLWGTIGVATQAIYNGDSATSLFINLARNLVATPVLLAACWRVLGRATFRMARRGFQIVLLTGTLLAVSQASYFAGIRYAGVTIASLLTLCIAPPVVALISVALKLETLNGRVLIALLCAVVGSVLLVGLPSLDTPSNVLLGTLFSLLAAITYAGVLVGERFLAADYPPLQVTALTFGVATVVLALINAASGFVAVHTAQGWLLIVYLGLVPTALAYWLFQVGLGTVSATAASIVSMLDPVVAALLAWLLFGETLATAGIAGALLLIASLFLLSSGKPAPETV